MADTHVVTLTVSPPRARVVDGTRSGVRVLPQHPFEETVPPTVTPEGLRHEEDVLFAW